MVQMNADAPDRVEPDGTLLIHMQTVGASNEGDGLFPDYVYGGWWHIGLHDYDGFAAAMATRAAAPYVYPQLFWTGNVEMSPSRSRLVEMSAAHPGRIDARGMRWAHARGNVTEETGERADTDGWVTLQRHAEWRYLIDVEGMGWSGRLKLLPHAHRPLLVQQRLLWDWASSRLREGEHYVRVGPELEELLPTLDWLDAHPAEAERMAAAASGVANRTGFGLHICTHICSSTHAHLCPSTHVRFVILVSFLYF